MAREETLAPIRQSVHVDCPPEDAFRLFTEGFGEWWPLAASSVTDDAEECAMEPWEGGKIFERTGSGEELEWGSVTVWDPPRRLEFTWQLGADANGHQRTARDDEQTVRVDFGEEGDGTRVTLTHHGWHLSGVAVCASRFAAFVAEQALVAA